jgi:hypothetical protein
LLFFFWIQVDHKDGADLDITQPAIMSVIIDEMGERVNKIETQLEKNEKYMCWFTVMQSMNVQSILLSILKEAKDEKIAWIGTIRRVAYAICIVYTVVFIALYITARFRKKK